MAPDVGEVKPSEFVDPRQARQLVEELVDEVRPDLSAVGIEEDRSQLLDVYVDLARRPRALFLERAAVEDDPVDGCIVGYRDAPVLQRPSVDAGQEGVDCVKRTTELAQSEPTCGPDDEGVTAVGHQDHPQSDTG